MKSMKFKPFSTDVVYTRYLFHTNVVVPSNDFNPHADMKSLEFRPFATGGMYTRQPLGANIVYTQQSLPVKISISMLTEDL